VIDREEKRIRTNRELYQLYDEKDIVNFCTRSTLRWAGHVMRQDDDDLARRKATRGRLRLRWKDRVKQDVAKLTKTKSSVALVRTRTIPTERPPPVDEVSANFCG